MDWISIFITVYKRQRRTKLLVYAARWCWQKQSQEDWWGVGATAGNIEGEMGSFPTYATLIWSGPKKLFRQRFKVMSWSTYIGMSNGLCLFEGGSVGRHHMGPIRKHPDRIFCLILIANASVGWQTDWFFLLGEPLKFPLQTFYIQNTIGTVLWAG